MTLWGTADDVATLRDFASAIASLGCGAAQDLASELILLEGYALRWIFRGMQTYLARHPEGKKFHDPLAACCAIDESIGTWAEVELFRARGEWGSRLRPGSNTWIIVDYDPERFIATLMA